MRREIGEKLLDGDATAILESLHEVRLTALLHDLMKEGKLEAAQLLGVTHKGLTAALDSGVLTPRLSDAMENDLWSWKMEAFENSDWWDERLKSCVEAVERWGKNISGEIKEVVGREAERRLAEDASPEGTSTRILSILSGLTNCCYCHVQFCLQ